jgi:hypothetical protein
MVFVAMATSFPSLYAIPQYSVHPPPGQKSGHASDTLWLRHAEVHTHSIAQWTLTPSFYQVR